MNLDPQFSLLTLAGVFAVAYVAVKFFWKFDTKVEGQRRVAFEVAANLKAKGLKFLPALLQDYAVGDYSGMAAKLEKVAVVLTHDPKAVDKEFEEVFTNLLGAKLADPVERAKLVALITPAPAAKVPGN